MPSAARALAQGAAMATGVVICDQVAKAIVRDRIVVGDELHVVGPFDIAHVRNTGVAFSALRNSGALIYILVIAAVVLLLWYFVRHIRMPLLWLPAGIVLGGAVGNLIDRVRLGAVTDFLSFWDFPVFNVADMAITVGIVLLALVIELAERRSSRRSEQ